MSRSLPPQAGAHTPDLVTACALTAACVRAGLDVTGALAATGVVWGREGTDETGLAEVAFDLRRGQDWADAWSRCAPSLAPMARALEPAWERGASPVAALETLATATVARRKAAALTAAAELGVRMTLPVTLCLLPAFIVVGVVPLIIALGAGVVGEAGPAVGPLTPSDWITNGDGGPSTATKGAS